MSRRIVLKLSLSISVLLWSISAVAQDAAESRGDSGKKPTLQDDYVYGYAPVIMEATKNILTAVPQATYSGAAPINQFAYDEGLATPSERLVPRPNADTLGTKAWLDLSAQPIILHVPDVAGRYYLIPMLDAYSNEFASIGTRTTGGGEGNYAIVGPRWHGQISEPVDGVITAPTDCVWLLGRTLVNGQADLPAAVAITKQYQLVPLSSFKSFLESGEYVPPSNVPVVPPNPNFVALPVTNSPGLSMPDFFDVLSLYTLQNPPPKDQLLESLALVTQGALHQRELTSITTSVADQAMIKELLTSSTQANGWRYNLNVGNYGTDYLLRAAIAKYGLGANIPADAIYMTATEAADGAPFNGQDGYVIHFAPGTTPPQRGFWSITVYDQDGFLVPNSIDRFDVGSQTGLVSNPDGSIDIYLQSTAPYGHESNWLPIPNGQFSLTLRIYWPQDTVLRKEWAPPPVRRDRLAM